MCEGSNYKVIVRVFPDFDIECDVRAVVAGPLTTLPVVEKTDP